jgi:hypothetical protein
MLDFKNITIETKNSHILTSIFQYNIIEHHPSIEMIMFVGKLLKKLHHVVLISIKGEIFSSPFLSNFAKEVMIINTQNGISIHAWGGRFFAFTHLNILLKMVLLPQTLKLLFVLFY